MTKANFTLKKTFYYLCSMVLIGLLTPFLGVSQTFTGAGNPQDVGTTDGGTTTPSGIVTTSAASSTLVGAIGTEYEIVAVNMDITHTFDGDIEATLISPDGTMLDLTSDNGGADDNFTMTVFQDGGSDITAGAGPFTGTFEPEGGTFAATFDGDDVNGDWVLSITDDAGGDFGTLNSYSIEFAALAPPPPPGAGGQTCGTGTAATPIDIPDNTFDGSLGSMASYTTAVSGVPVGANITGISASVPFRHTWVGDLTIVLEAPDGRLLPLMSNPGGPGFGDSSDANVHEAGGPLTWRDGGATDAEDMGSTIGGTEIVGLDDGLFEYFPNGDGVVITGGGANVANFAALYDLSDAANGDWTIHMGDQAGGDTGRLFGLEVCIDYEFPEGLYITDPCSCLDNATPIDAVTGTGGDDGQFSETVSVLSAGGAGLFFKVTLVAGAYDLVTGLPISVGEDLVYNAAGGGGTGSYDLSFAHNDNAGYQIRVRQHDNMGVFFGPEYGIGNKCAYPNPTFVPVLDEVYCDFQSAVTLGATAPNGGTATFTVDGAAATQFDPSAAAAGTHTVVMSFDGAADGNGGISPDGGTTAAYPGCTQEVVMDVEVEELNVGCISSINVTLDNTVAACNADVTPQMVLTGDYACVDNFVVNIDGLPTSKVTGCGDHTYMVELYVDGVLQHTCWGDVLAEDKDAPFVDCPANTNTGLVDFNRQIVLGALDGTEPTLVLNDYSCFSDAFNPLAGAHNYDIVTFTVSDTDVYTFFWDTQFGDGNMTLYQGGFNPSNPCQNVIAHNEDAAGPFIDFDPAERLSLPLIAGETYTALLSNWDPADLGQWALIVYSDHGNQIEDVVSEGVPTVVPVQPLTLNFPLICNDIENIQITGQEQYVVNANGSNPGVQNGGMSPALREKLLVTGIPAAITDNCGQILVTVSDVVTAAGDCGDVTITRTWHAADRYNSTCTGDPLTYSCDQIITFRKPTINDIIFPPFAAPIECDEGFATDGATGGPDDNPAASVTGYPWLITAFGFVNLDDDYCNIGASYSDEPRIDVCSGTYKFRREWNIIDWCDAGSSVIYNQIVKVGNFTGPEVSIDITNNNGSDDTRIEISTSPFSCTANYSVHYANTVTNCGAVATSQSDRLVTILDANGDYVWAGRELQPNGQPTVVTGLEIGAYTATWCITDDCGNETCRTYDLIVTDEIAPTASCNDQINVSIGGGDVHNGIEGIARIYATEVDEGSYDNCEIDRILIRRNHFDRGPDLTHYTPDDTCHPSENRWSNWNEYINFFCCDIGNEITIEMRVYDTNNNFNTCWFVVTPEDKLIPYCYPPASVNIDCNELPETFPGDLQLAYDEEPVATRLMMDLLFGYAWGTDNCAVDSVVERNPTINLNDCGWGAITRRFEIWQWRVEGDANGNGEFDRSEAWVSNNACSQVIYVNEVHEYHIDFPEDASADCADPCIWDIATTTEGCDILAVNTAEPVRFAATGDECYKLSITYDVINWCLWDGEYEGYTIPRMTENDNQFVLDRAVEGAERPILWGDDNGVILDRDHDDRYPGLVFNPANDRRRPICPDGTTFLNPSLDDSYILDETSATNPDLNRGRWNYTQFIKVYDTTVPEVTVDAFGGPTDLCPDLEAGQFGDPYGDCNADVHLTFSVSDDCELIDGAGDLVISIVSAELDAFVADVNGDGVIKANEFSADHDITITDNGDGTYAYWDNLPIITNAMGDNIYHAIKVVLEDGCGNTTNEIIRIDVIDCKGPAPICINGLTVTLMPVEGTDVDADGDGDTDNCAMAIWASDFEGSAIFDCTGQGPETNGGLLRVHKYAIYRVDEVDDITTFVPDPTHTGTIFTDDDLSDELINVYVFAFDQDGNYDYCQTYVQVEAHETCNVGEQGTLSGIIATEAGETVQGVDVNVNGDLSITTDASGHFLFTLPARGDYTLTPYLNAEPLNGVSTFDLVLMSKHILGVDLLDSPYKRIAADANQSGTITTLDMIQIRKLILNIDTEFSNNTSWRFIPANHVFADATNPWAGAGFPELVSVNDLAPNASIDLPFVGVKVGDVSGNAVANLLSSDDRTLNGQFNFNVENTDIKVGNTYTVAFTGADIASVKGYQATLALAGAELVDIEYGVATAENFGLRFAEQGMITTSWNGEATSEDVLFSLVIRATADAQLSDVIKVSSRYTAAEAYDANTTSVPMAIGINFSGVEVVAAGFELYQNTPNPFQAKTMISYNLPADAKATITISDISGRVLLTVDQDATAGYNTYDVTKAMINNTTGVLSYTVTAGDFSATKSMIVVK